VFNSGNLVLDLLHNFFLENGARTHKLSVYEMTDHPAARQMLGYLFVRGGVHAHAYALALEQLTGVEMKKMLPIPKIGNVQLPESRPFEERGFHRKLYRFSPNDYKDVAARSGAARPSTAAARLRWSTVRPRAAISRDWMAPATRSRPSTIPRRSSRWRRSCTSGRDSRKSGSF
jgi:Mn-containing catalase